MLRGRIGRKARAWALAAGLALFGWLAFTTVFFLAVELPESGRLAREYPMVRYLGPESPPEVEWSAKRPRGWTEIREIPRAVVGAVVVSEDWSFFEHPGVDWDEIRDAIETDLQKRRFSRGASTITQQVARNVFLHKRKTIIRKLKEIGIAFALEKSLAKRRILEVYFNVAEWGQGIYGIRAASRFYFKKAPHELAPKEGAFLAMLLPSPKRYSQSFRARHLTSFARKRVASILRKMVSGGYLSEEARRMEAGVPLAFEWRPAPESIPALLTEEGLTEEPEPREGDSEEEETPEESEEYEPPRNETFRSLDS